MPNSKNRGFQVGRPTSRALQQAGSSEPPVMIDPGKVPVELHELIPFAERFGFVDDVMRHASLRASDDGTRDGLKRLLRRHADALDAWLAGPEAEGPPWSPEYLAFSALNQTY